MGTTLQERLGIGFIYFARALRCQTPLLDFLKLSTPHISMPACKTVESTLRGKVILIDQTLIRITKWHR